MKQFLALIIIVVTSQVALAQPVIDTYFPGQTIVAGDLPAKKNVWAFLLAGQSNMAGRGVVEPSDTIPDPRILTINKKNEIVVAKEPLHFYEPTRTGLDCGLSFARTLLKSAPENVTILLVPTAVGGSSIHHWLQDSTWRDVRLLSNAKEKIALALKVSVFKGILWHQGESNANTAKDIEQHPARLKELASIFRKLTGDRNLPFLMGELGSFSKNPEQFQKLNQQLSEYSKTDRRSAVIETGDLGHKGDFLHFNSEAQRKMGERFANAYISKFL
ncbi:MAG TPA: sialate O-acetylesterase [Cyclobacteriaceae bacterium]|nr:sialate O-acetylesterase [Cyclobacteriaceae bacterium]